MYISDFKFKHGIFLAPLAGVTDMPFRKICKHYGAELVFSEMVSAKALYYEDKKTNRMTYVNQEERPVAIQIFGSDPKIMGYAAKMLSKREDIDIIDINMGCPVSKIIKNNEGSALIKDIDLSEKIVKEVIRNSSKPITVKTRLGWDSSDDIIEFSKMVNSTGASALILHGRTKKQMYRGTADWDMIKKVKECISIPVIGNGDLVSGEKAKELKEYSKVDGIMIGRGSLGNPWIFKEVIAAFDNEEYLRPSKDEMLNNILDQLEEMIQQYGERAAILQIRKHLGWYVKGMDNCNEFKRKVFSIDSKAELNKTIIKYFMEGSI